VGANLYGCLTDLDQFGATFANHTGDRILFDTNEILRGSWHGIANRTGVVVPTQTAIDGLIADP